MLASGNEPLLLLTSAAGGYFIPTASLARLIPKFGRDQAGHDYKIDESKVRREWRFRSLEEPWDLLRPKLA